MQFIITHSRTRRKIEGPLSICASEKDFQTLVNCVKTKLDNGKFSYGWIDITETAEMLPNTAPIGWDDGNSEDPNPIMDLRCLCGYNAFGHIVSLNPNCKVHQEVFGMAKPNG